MSDKVPSSDEAWTWDVKLHPLVLRVLDEPSDELEWCDNLENSPSDSIVGKVLCVCVAMAIARNVLIGEFGDTETFAKAIEPLNLLNNWVDSPTNERFDRICSLIFGENRAMLEQLDPHGVDWWALRVSTSSVGYYEAGWALSGVWRGAVMAGFNDQTLHEIAKGEVLARRHLPE